MKKFFGVTISTLVCAGVFLFSSTVNASNRVTMYRMYNHTSGEHFYTSSEAEKSNLLLNGWKSEGVGWIAPTEGDDVYRLYNPNSGDHHYTMSSNERDTLKNIGWKYEGVGWKSSKNKEIPLYRAYNPNARVGSHNYTTNLREQLNLYNSGWHDEGIAWYGISIGSNDAFNKQLFQNLMLEKVNDLRKSVGVNPLTYNTNAQSQSEARTRELEKSFSHTRPNGESFVTAFTNGNNIFAENILKVTRYDLVFSTEEEAAEHFFNSWKNSPGHYTNMVRPTPTKFNVSIYFGAENGVKTVYSSQHFGK